MLTEMVTRPRLIKAIRKLSQYFQTSGLEANHSLDNLLATKNTYYSHHSLSVGVSCNTLKTVLLVSLAITHYGTTSPCSHINM